MGRGRGRGNHGMSGIRASPAISHLQDYSNDNMNYSNDALDYHDSNENPGTEHIITESFLQQVINDGDSDIAEEDPVIVDPTEKIEPGTSEYIEVKDDYKETDISTLQTATTTENIDSEPETDERAASAKESSTG